MRTDRQTRLIAISERVYQSLLVLYPAEFRIEYGALMLQVFRDASRDRYRAGGFAGITFWWCATLLDLTVTAIEQRRNLKIVLAKATLIQLAGVFLIVGGICVAIASYSQLQPDDHDNYHDLYQLAMSLLLPGYTLIGVGIVGILLGYGRGLGFPGRLALVAMSIGALTMVAGFGLSVIQEAFWIIGTIGFCIHTFGVVGFGLVHLRTGFPPVMRWLPILLVLQPLALIIGIFGLDVKGTGEVAQFVWLIGIGACWILMGIAVHRHQLRPIPALVSA